MLYINKHLCFNEVEGQIEPVLKAKAVQRALQLHQGRQEQLTKLKDYYDGKHGIKNRIMPTDRTEGSSKAVFNHAKNIVDTSVGYVFGNPVVYNNLNSNILDRFIAIDEDSHNVQLGTDQAIYGVAYELLYYVEDEFNTNNINLGRLCPINTNVVYDTGISKEPIFAFTYSINEDLDGNKIGYTVIVYDKNYIYTYRTQGIDSQSNLDLVDLQPHIFKGIPVIELQNNDNCQGDFEGVMDIIDADNIVMNDRIDDTERFMRDLLFLKNFNMGETTEEVREVIKFVKKHGYLSADAQEGYDVDAKYLSKSFSQSDIEILHNNLTTLIHKLSHVPDTSDENFAGQSSGIALRYRLFGFQQLGEVKQRFFKSLLRKRLVLINNIETVRNSLMDLSKIDIQMELSIPEDREQKLKELQATDGILSLETRIARFDAEIDVQEEMAKIMKEKELNMQLMSKAYGDYSFPLEDNSLNKATEKDKEIKNNEEEK